MGSNDRARSMIVRSRVLVGVAVSVIAVAVWATARMQHRAADHASDLGRASQRMLTAMLDQQTGLRGYALTRQASFLDPYRDGIMSFEEAVARASRLADDDLRVRIDAQVEVAREWQALAEADLSLIRAARGEPCHAPSPRTLHP